MESTIKTLISVERGEKASLMLQTQNKVPFIVGKKSNRVEIKKEVEKLFDVKVEKVNILNKQDGSRVAIVKLRKGYNATDLATKLGII
jgi:large subunit ribosomal protein L23